MNQQIEGVIWQSLTKYQDERGWSCELWRDDELPTFAHQPVMGYMSVSEPGQSRGPHEHREQMDCFCFPGQESFKVQLWDRRSDSSTFGMHAVFYFGKHIPQLLVVPPGVVHSYTNIGKEPGIVLNFPNRLYKGPYRRDPVDEVRYENQSDSPYRLEGTV